MTGSTTNVPPSRPGKNAIGLSVDEFREVARGHACDFYYDRYPKRLKTGGALQVLVKASEDGAGKKILKVVRIK